MTIQDYFSFDITPFIKRREYQAGDMMFREGEEINRLIYIEEGTAKSIQTQENGKQCLIAYFQEPCFMGDLELIGARRTTCGVYAVTDCRCVILYLDRIKNEILSDVKFLRYLCRVFGRKAVRNGDNLNNGRSYPLKNRLATFILDMENHGVYTIPHTEAAQFLGVSYRHLLYVLADMTEQGILEKKKSGYHIQNRRQLEEWYLSNENTN